VAFNDTVLQPGKDYAGLAYRELEGGIEVAGQTFMI
jgi:hypothetical protein